MMDIQERSENLTADELLREQKVRKRWLIALFVSYLPQVIIFLLVMAGLFYLWPVIEEKNKQMDAWLLGFSMISPFISFWITYHCAYKKSGTAWLLFILFTAPAGFIAYLPRTMSAVTSATEVLSMAFQLTADSAAVWGQVFLLGVLVMTAIDVYFLVNCFALYRVNKLRKQTNLAKYVGSKELSSCVSQMEEALDSTTLDALFFSAISKWPQWEERLTFVYKKRKDLLQGGSSS